MRWMSRHARQASAIALAAVAWLCIAAAPQGMAPQGTGLPWQRPIHGGPDLVGLYLTWSKDPTTTMTVNWVDLYPDSPSEVHWRRMGDSQWTLASAMRATVEPSALQRRWVELTGLQPDAMYEFGIGPAPEPPADEKAVKAIESSTWRFRTMPAALSPARPLRIVNGGDMMHTRAMVDAMNSQAAQIQPDFAILGGDLAYDDGVRGARVIDWLESWMRISVAADRRLIPIVVGIGNHEVRGGYGGRIPADAPYFYGLFTLPDGRSHYALDFGGYLSVVMLDSGHTTPVAGAQAQWLESALAARSASQFLVACYHYPAYGTAKAPEGGLPIDNPRSVAIRQAWVPHFERYGITVALEHDHHNFKRTHRLRRHARDDDNGILYIGDGAWGVETRTVPTPQQGWWLAKASPTRHLWDIELRSDGTATMRAVADDGRVLDTVTLASPRTRPDAQHQPDGQQGQ